MYLNLIKIHYGGLFLILVVLMAQKKQMYIYGSLLSCANYYIDIYFLYINLQLPLCRIMPLSNKASISLLVLTAALTGRHSVAQLAQSTAGPWY